MDRITAIKRLADTLGKHLLEEEQRVIARMIYRQLLLVCGDFLTTEHSLTPEERALSNTNRIGAIKAVRNRTGITLVEAKELVDRFLKPERD
jgi:hypothetical protein